MEGTILRVIAKAVDDVVEARRVIGGAQVVGKYDEETESVWFRRHDKFELSIPLADCVGSGYETVEDFRAWFDLIISKAMKQLGRRRITAKAKIAKGRGKAVAPKRREEGDEEGPDLTSKEIDFRAPKKERE